MLPATNIRKATEEDIPIIQQIAFSTWPVAYSAILEKEQLEYMLDMFYSTPSLKRQMVSGDNFLVAEFDKNIIGFASFNMVEKDIMKLHKLYVLPTTQKVGAGKFLLQEVIRLTQLAGIHKLQLNVNRHNKAIGFYEKMGFVIIKEDDINIGRDYYMNDYVMELNC